LKIVEKMAACPVLQVSKGEHAKGARFIGLFICSLHGDLPLHVHANMIRSLRWLPWDFIGGFFLFVFSFMFYADD
jgi:hypothetical protein